MWSNIWQWIEDNPRSISIGAFFAWGVLVAITAPAIDSFLAIPVLILYHLVSGAGIYFGWLKNKDGRRSILGIVLNLITMLYNLTFASLQLLV